MHTNRSYEFDNEVEAKEFADNERANKAPHEDKYVSGPFFMDEDEIFKNMMWASTGRKYWKVSVEVYR